MELIRPCPVCGKPVTVDEFSPGFFIFHCTRCGAAGGIDQADNFIPAEPEEGEKLAAGKAELIILHTHDGLRLRIRSPEDLQGRL